MSADDDVFIGGGASASEVRQIIEETLGGKFALSADADPVPVLAVGPAQVFFHESHPYEDDTDLPLSRYKYQVSVHDIRRDEESQLVVARLLFDVACLAGWQALLVRDLQEVVARHP
jgi:hypothetical protein